MESEGPYEHLNSVVYGKCISSCPACAYAEGRKAERERCLAIANRHPDKCDGITLSDCMETIKDEIRGGQDGK